MTCIVGLVDNGKVYIGGDSLTVGGLNCAVVKQPKVFINGDFIMGYTTSWRMGQLLHHSFTPPKHFPDVDIMKYMVTDFIDEIRACFKIAGYLTIESNVEEGGQFLVGYKGKLFNIWPDFQVSEAALEFDSVGCGYYYALGAMYESDTGVLSDPKIRIERALEAAENFSGGVRRPFIILSN